jgi:hypothetical protein
VFCWPIQNVLAVPLKSSKALLERSQHRFRYCGIAALLDRIGDDFALARNAVSAFSNESINLSQRLVAACHRHRSLPQSSSACGGPPPPGS